MGPPGVSRNAFNNPSFPKIPDFPFKDNMNMSNPLMNGTLSQFYILLKYVERLCYSNPNWLF